MAARRILITGATGKQGGAVLNALLSLSDRSSTTLEILALTRKPDSAKAKLLASKPNITVIQGQPSDAAAVFAKTGRVDSIFLVSVPGPFRSGAEEEQAIPSIDMGIAHGVKHIVYTSIDRGGPVASEFAPTGVRNFAAKYRIEKYLKDKASKSGVSWTILRPVAFMEMISPGLMGRIWTTVLAGVETSKPLQMVSLRDVGYFGAAALLEPDRYSGQAIGIAGDELSLNQARKVFQETFGYKLPETYGFVRRLLRFMFQDVREMTDWVARVGYKVDIPTLKATYHDLRDFSTYLHEDSGFAN
jgi:uncharacterized protein YbjT (DUF2867 family)